MSQPLGMTLFMQVANHISKLDFTKKDYGSWPSPLHCYKLRHSICLFAGHLLQYSFLPHQDLIGDYVLFLKTD